MALDSLEAEPPLICCGPSALKQHYRPCLDRIPNVMFLIPAHPCSHCPLCSCALFRDRRKNRPAPPAGPKTETKNSPALFGPGGVYSFLFSSLSWRRRRP